MGRKIDEVDRLIADLDDLASKANGDRAKRLAKLRDDLEFVHEPHEDRGYEIVSVPKRTLEDILTDPLNRP